MILIINLKENLTKKTEQKQNIWNFLKVLVIEELEMYECRAIIKV